MKRRDIFLIIGVIIFFVISSVVITEKNGDDTPLNKYLIDSLKNDSIRKASEVNPSNSIIEKRLQQKDSFLKEESLRKDFKKETLDLLKK